MLGNDDNVGDNCIQDVRTGKNPRTYIELGRHSVLLGLPILAFHYIVGHNI